MDLTVIIPTYNRNNNVVECVYALDHVDADIVVIDDGSEQPVVLPSKTARVLRHNRHRGRGASINTGLRAAANDLVLIIDDDVYAAPEMAGHLVAAFEKHNDPKLALTPRVVWDPDIPLTLTMRWLEEMGKFSKPILFWKPFVTERGGFDENLFRGLEDTEFALRFEQHGLEIRMLEEAVGFQNRVIRIRDLAAREFLEGVSAVYLHSKFPSYTPVVEDTDTLLRNEKQTRDAEAAVEEISLFDQSESSSIPAGASDLFVHVCRYYFLHGIFEGLRDIGGLQPPQGNSSTLAIYNHASYLEKIGEFDEAKRLFRLVLHRRDQEYRSGAEFHLGRIESELGDPGAARFHFMECLRQDPSHGMARRALNISPMYSEAAPNVFESVDRNRTTRLLFVVFGELADIVNAFPVVAALRERFSSEIVWLTSPPYVRLAQTSFADAVREADQRGIIPWEWARAGGFTHVFCPEIGANLQEWRDSGLHPIDFMAEKCGVPLETHRSWLEPGADALFEAEEFMRQHGLTRNGFLTASHVSEEGRHWPQSNLMNLARHVDVPVVVFGKNTGPEIPDTICCFDKPFEVVAALIRWSSYYVGSDSGISWLATTTDTPMAVFVDGVRANRFPIGYRSVLRGEKENIQEWDIHTSLDTVLDHIGGSVRLVELAENVFTP